MSQAESSQETTPVRSHPLSIQVAVLTQRLQQSEQLNDELRRREEASKKAYSMLLQTFNELRGGESESLIKGLKDEIMLLNRKEPDYVLRNQCNEIMQWIHSSMKKSSYPHPTSRAHSVSRDPPLERHREAAEVTSFHKLVSGVQSTPIRPLYLERGVSLSQTNVDLKEDDRLDRDRSIRRNLTLEADECSYSETDNHNAVIERKNAKIAALKNSLKQKEAMNDTLRTKILELSQKLSSETYGLTLPTRFIDLNIELLETKVYFPSLSQLKTMHRHTQFPSVEGLHLPDHRQDQPAYFHPSIEEPIPRGQSLLSSLYNLQRNESRESAKSIEGFLRERGDKMAARDLRYMFEEYYSSEAPPRDDKELREYEHRARQFLAERAKGVDGAPPVRDLIIHLSQGSKFSSEYMGGIGKYSIGDPSLQPSSDLATQKQSEQERIDTNSVNQFHVGIHSQSQQPPGRGNLFEQQKELLRVTVQQSQTIDGQKGTPVLYKNSSLKELGSANGSDSNNHSRKGIPRGNNRHLPPSSPKLLPKGDSRTRNQQAVPRLVMPATDSFQQLPSQSSFPQLPLQSEITITDEAMKEGKAETIQLSHRKESMRDTLGDADVQLPVSFKQSTVKKSPRGRPSVPVTGRVSSSQTSARNTNNQADQGFGASFGRIPRPAPLHLRTDSENPRSSREYGEHVADDCNETFEEALLKNRLENSRLSKPNRSSQKSQAQRTPKGTNRKSRDNPVKVTTPLAPSPGYSTGKGKVGLLLGDIFGGGYEEGLATAAFPGGLKDKEDADVNLGSKTPSAISQRKLDKPKSSRVSPLCRVDSRRGKRTSRDNLVLPTQQDRVGSSFKETAQHDEEFRFNPNFKFKEEQERRQRDARVDEEEPGPTMEGDHQQQSIQIYPGLKPCELFRTHYTSDSNAIHMTCDANGETQLQYVQQLKMQGRMNMPEYSYAPDIEESTLRNRIQGSQIHLLGGNITKTMPMNVEFPSTLLRESQSSPHLRFPPKTGQITQDAMAPKNKPFPRGPSPPPPGNELSRAHSQPKTDYKELLGLVRSRHRSKSVVNVQMNPRNVCNSLSPEMNHQEIPDPPCIDRNQTQFPYRHRSFLTVNSPQPPSIGNSITPSMRKHMKFQTNLCGLIKHVEINLVEDSQSSDEHPQPENRSPLKPSLNISRRVSNVSNKSKIGIGQKGRQYLGNRLSRDKKVESKTDRLPTVHLQVNKENALPLSDFRERNNHNTPRQKTPVGTAKGHKDKTPMRAVVPKAKDEKRPSPLLMKEKRSNADSFLGVQLKDLQTEVPNDIEMQTDRSNGYALRCRGSPLSACKYNEGKPALPLREREKERGKEEVQERGSGVPSHGRNETFHSVHDSILMMHEILVDKVSDLQLQLQKSSGKKNRPRPRLINNN